jgi:DNA-directed RNA polymerase alpha subunit
MVETAVNTDTWLDTLDLNLRILNRLGSVGILRVGDLRVYRASDLRKLLGIGPQSIRDIEHAMHQAGHALRTEEP